jgi:hypothetical protein
MVVAGWTKNGRDGMMQINTRFVDLLAIYRSELLQRTIPFWLKHAIDWQHGGILTCISDKGQVLSEDKYIWSQLLPCTTGLNPNRSGWR